jgi:PAS domain S-box-containing protein
VGGDSDYAPFTYIDKTGKAAGLEIDVLNEIAGMAHLELDINLTPWEVAYADFRASKTDLLVGILHSEERATHFDFTIPIHTEYYSIFIRKDLPLDDLSSLFNYKLIALNQDVSIEKYLIPMGLYKDYKVAGSLPEALSAIELGLADYVIAPNLLGIRTIKANNYKNIAIKGPSILPVIYCFAVQKGNIQLLNVLNKGIEELRNNGRLTKLQEKWKLYNQGELSNRQWVRIISSVFAVALVLLILVTSWGRTLRVQLTKQTESLNQKNLELQKSEEKFRIITENSSDIIWHLDSNLCLTYISPADERIRGFKREEVLGQSLLSILKPEGIELIVEANKNRLNNLSKGIRSAPVVYELEQRTKDGNWIWIEATATATYDMDGTITGYHGVSRDISERKKAELLLKERESQLRELNATKDKLFSIIAHDLRSPFNSIIGFSELLARHLKSSATPETEMYLGYIQTSAKQTLTLLENLLIWAKSQTGQNPFNPISINLSMLIRYVVDMSRSAANLKKIELKFIESEMIDVFADMNMLNTILRNLISNAIKYTHENGNITISTIKQEEVVEVRITDNGVGMSEQTLKGLFAIDSTITTSGTANEQGTGLGLVLCKDLIEIQGGKIGAKSSNGQGSEFIITLPLAIPSPEL